ncbi:inositol polyphosphate 5-phosphatase, putative, partial [Entamoeba invadens IP1]|uniref:inositol polyphosphate 5-phosphatase, putative n=1 Tax=Entamoeba invadens IP1 TaxID=370355 RepID=UPI0002C3E81B
TFKVEIGKESCEYVENRIPSWCDRVLWKTENCHFAETQKYNSYEIFTSDHKPVSSLITLDLHRVNKERCDEVIQYRAESEKRYKEITVAKVVSEPSEIQFEDVELFTTYTQTVTLKNVGKFRVVYEIEGCEYCEYNQDWLTISPCSGVLDVFEGKNSVVLKLSVCIDKSIAWMNQDRNKLLKKIYVSLGEEEKISFVVRVKTKVSVIGMRLESLNRMPKPLIGNLIHEMNKPPFFIPKELYRIVDRILKKYSKGCFEETPLCMYSKKQMSQFVNALDTENEFPEGPVQLFCDGLLLFLSGLHDSVLHCDGSQYSEEVSVKCLITHVKYIIPDDNRNLFVYLCSFAQKMVELGEEVGTIVRRITPPLFRCYNKQKALPFLNFFFKIITDGLSVSFNANNDLLI